VIFLNASVENQYQATKDKTKRPLLNNENPKQVLESLYEHRLDLYKSVSNLELNTDLLSNEDIVKEIISFLNV
jgi:shikimate kinase